MFGTGPSSNGTRGIEPETQTGGQQKLQERLNKMTADLGSWLGKGIILFVVIVLAIEFILNPLFIIAQAQAEGVDVSPQLDSLQWWVRVNLLLLLTFATSGVQWALLAQGGGEGRQIGRVVGWIIAIGDTAMDGAGFLAWINGGSLTDFTFDQASLLGGLFPPPGADAMQWVGVIAIWVICLGNEPFFTKILGRLTFDVDDDTEPFAKNISIYSEKAGELYNGVKFRAIHGAPICMFAMDLILFPLSAADQNSVYVVVWIVLSVMITLGGIAVWEYFNHLRKVGGYKISDLSAPLKRIAFFAFAITIVDSVFDLRGFNEALFGEVTFLPPMDGLSGPLTAVVVLLMCTACEPMVSDIFAPLAKLNILPNNGGGPRGPIGSPGNARPMPGA